MYRHLAGFLQRPLDAIAVFASALQSLSIKCESDVEAVRSATSLAARTGSERRPSARARGALAAADRTPRSRVPLADGRGEAPAARALPHRQRSHLRGLRNGQRGHGGVAPSTPPARAAGRGGGGTRG